MNTSRHFVQALLYHQAPRFTTVRGFLDRLEPGISHFGYDHEGATRAIDSSLDLLHETTPRGDSNAAFAVLAAEDLQIARSRLSDPRAVGLITCGGDLVGALQEALEIFLDYLHQKGVDMPAPSVHVVDEFPQPFTGRPIAALNLDSADSLAFGVPVGIYFKRGNLRPLYSVFLLAHELTHTILGERSPLELARGLEEGIAELVGGLVLAPLVLGSEVALNITMYNRLYPLQGDLLDRYLPYLRQAALLYHHSGTDGILSLLDEGRGALKRAEASIVAGDLPRLRRTSIPDPVVERGLRLLCVSTSPLSICSPEARLVLRYTQSGALVREMAHRSRLQVGTVSDALSELEEQFSFVTMSSDKTIVRFADSSLESIRHSLLYLC